jgi:23S rRNA (uracil1939-C5)-methyltransferase
MATRRRSQVGEAVDVTIEKAVYGGLGLARHEGLVILVPKALPGERLRVRVARAEKGYARADVVETLEGAADARPTPCPFFPRCGGCSYQHLDYTAQLRLKEGVLRESLSRAGVAWDRAIPIDPSPEQAWRMRASFHVDARGGELRLGLRQESSRRVVDLSGACLQVSEAMNGALRHIRDVLASRPALARKVRDVHLAEALDGRALVAGFEADLSASQAQSLGAASAEAAWLSGIGILTGPPAGQGFAILRGSPYLLAEVNGVSLRHHARSFFQSNRYLVSALAREVEHLLPPGGLLLDLFGGVGLFGLTAGRGAERVIIVEGNATATADAVENAGSAGRPEVRVEQGDVLEALERRRPEADERVIVDPPRSGLGASLVSTISARGPEAVVYVSCDPATLARDLKVFEAHGYRPDSLRALDLFPDTFHLETVARLVP